MKRIPHQPEKGSQASAHGQLLHGVRKSIHKHPALSHLWGEWPGSSGLSLAFLESSPWSSATFQGERHQLELCLQTSPSAKQPGPSELDLLIGHLDNLQLPLTGHALIEFRFATARTEARGAEGAACHIRFDALTLADPPFSDGHADPADASHRIA
jgi:hypothetical protein